MMKTFIAAIVIAIILGFVQGRFMLASYPASFTQFFNVAHRKWGSLVNLIT